MLPLIDDPEPGNFFVFVSCVRCEAVCEREEERFLWLGFSPGFDAIPAYPPTRVISCFWIFVCIFIGFYIFLFGLVYKTSIFSRVSCDSLGFGAKCETVVIFRSLVSRVSCDSFVFGAKCETLVTFTSLKVARAVFRQHLHTCVQKLMIRCGFEVAHVARIVRVARFWSKVCNSCHF